ncbi:hypothetical protein AB0H71_02820 [Nocardia sp. NPDC050697]|uniref:hypothetical protein n=1 Tax=Nocardia sp. NPDC050697 TaxID=3155158 RepID=UPI0033C92776
MDTPSVSPALVESMRTDFDVLLAACWAEVEETASPETLATLHSPLLREVRANCLHYIATLLAGEMHAARLTRSKHRYRSLSPGLQRAEALRIEVRDEKRAELRERHHEFRIRGFEPLCRWLLALLRPEEYRWHFEQAATAVTGSAARYRLPAAELWSWAVTHGWPVPAATPEAERLLALDEDEFVRAVRRSLTVEYIPALDEIPVVERWCRALGSVEVEVRADIDETARYGPKAAHLRRLSELYEEFAVLRFHRGVAKVAFQELRNSIAAAVDGEPGYDVPGFHAAAAAACVAAHPELWQRIRAVVAAHRELLESPDFDFGTGSELAEMLCTAVLPETAVPSEPAEPAAVLPVETADPIEVAVDGSGFGATGGYGWAAADGRLGGGRCTEGTSATETEVLAICAAVLAPEFTGRPLVVLSDCVGAVEAVTAALVWGAPASFPKTEAVRERLRAAVARPIPFTVRWVRSRSGNMLHDRAHRLARAGRAGAAPAQFADLSA